MRHGKPIIGIAGGIGSGKSFVADLFGEMGCLVIKSDEQVSAAYRDPVILKELRDWWGDSAFLDDGSVDRRFIARTIFNNPHQRQKLEGLLHPNIARKRDDLMSAVANDPNIRAYVWDTPLLFETGLNRDCDAVVFVDAPLEIRLERVKSGRGWDEAELRRREILQTPLDKKQDLSDHTLSNTADAHRARSQVRELLSRILVEKTGFSAP